MRIGFSTVLWGRRIDNLGYVLDVIAACGYQGVEFSQHFSQIFIQGLHGVRPVTADELVHELEARGLELIGLVGGTLTQRKAFLGRHRQAYLYLDSWPEAEVEANLRDKDPFTLALHPHWFMQIRKLKHARALLDRHPDSPYLKLLMDTAHFVIAEDDPVRTVREELHRLAAVHLKSWKPNYGRWSHRYAHGFCPPGRGGIVPVEKVMDELHAVDFQGWVIMEQDHHDGSRADMALECVEWLTLQDRPKRWNLGHLRPDRNKVEKLRDAPPPNPFQQATEERRREEDLKEYRAGYDLSHLVSHSPRASLFYMRAAAVIRNIFDCVVVKVWSYNPMTQEFHLIGVDTHEDLKHLEQCMKVLQVDHSMPGRMLSNPKIICKPLADPEVRQHSQDKEFLARVSTHARWMTSMPVFNTSNTHHLRFLVTLFGQVSLQDKDNDRRHELERVSWVVAHWSDYLIDEICASASGATNHLCGEFKGGVTDFVNVLMAHLKREFRCMNVTLFLKDVSGTRLVPAGETDKQVEWTTEEHYYHQNEEKGLTVRAWREREMVFASDALEHPDHVGKARDKMPPGETREEILFAVLARWGGRVLGVVRLQNKVRPDHPMLSTMFTDDDAAKLDAIIQAALPYLELLVQQQGQAFALSCMAHELQNPLLGILGAADFLREKLRQRGLTNLAQSLGRDYVEDIFSYQTLASRLVRNARLFSESFDQITPVLQHTDVVDKVIRPIVLEMSPLLHKHRMPEDRIKIGGERIPWLYVDRSMLQQVFFNLLANAIKYNEGAADFHITVRWGWMQENPAGMGYYFEVEDEGIGIVGGKEEAEMLFLPGVRSLNAQRKSVEGTGIGLAVVSRVIAAHGGRAWFASYLKPTLLRIELPATLLYRPPPGWLEKVLNKPIL